MIIDSSLSFGTQNGASDAIGATSAEKVLTHIDVRPNVTDNATADLGAGEPLYFVLQIQTNLVDSSGESPVATFYLVTADDTALTSSPEILLSSDGIGVATLTAGARFVYTLPSVAHSDYKRYLGVKCKVNTGSGFDVGILEGFVTKDVSNWSATNTRTD
jgi:hypothetical protein